MSSKQFTAKVFRWLHQVNADLTLPASAAKIAICLSDHFNEKEGGVAWPSCRTIAAVIGKSEGTVCNVVRALHARGHVRVEWGQQGRGLSNRYWMIEKDSDQGELFDAEKPQPVEVFDTEKTSIFEAEKPQSAERKPQSVRKKPQPVEQNHLKNHRRTTEGEKDSPADVASRDLKNDAPRKKTLRAKARVAPAESFQEFWSVYPRRVAKEAARRAFERAVNAGAVPETLIAGAKRYAIERAGQEPRYTKHPATWLHAGCWEDEAPGAPVIDEHGNVVAIEQAQQQAPPRARGFAAIADELIAQGGEDWR